MLIRTIRPSDAPALLAFEQANRAWFESHIDARAPDFYSLAGVAAHIDECLASHAAGSMHPCLLVADDGAILGRCNLKDIDQASRRAEVGYRIAAHACGLGLAGVALRHLMELAYGHWQLDGLDAHVTVANAASSRVLERAGFTLAGASPFQARVAGELIDCRHFQHQG